MSVKWTPRVNGLIETTVAFSLHIPQDMVTWIKAQTGMSEADALDFVKNRVLDLADDWHTVAVDETGHLDTVSVDDVNQYVADGGVVYEGAAITLAPTRRRKR